MTRFPLFKGATRVATVGGVPLIPLVVLVLSVTSAGMLFGVFWLALFVPGFLFMAQVTRSDDRAFRILWLFGLTKLANRLRMLWVSGRGEYWGASSYSLTEGRKRRWEGEGGPWGG